MTHLQIREVFHLEFLRRLSAKSKPGQYVLKGGVNLRFFFKSPRYSEDMDLDVQGVPVHVLQDTVMGFLNSPSFLEGLKSFGVASLGVPDMRKAKQTETTQRFKVHLHTSGNLDLFTKIEFSRRGVQEGALTEPVPAGLLRQYRQPPMQCGHYGAEAAWRQKVTALAGRPVTQARDVFDLHLLGTQVEASRALAGGLAAGTIEKASRHALSIGFDQFQGAVLAYFPEAERAQYGNAEAWESVCLSVAQDLESMI